MSFLYTFTTAIVYIHILTFNSVIIRKAVVCTTSIWILSALSHFVLIGDPTAIKDVWVNVDQATMTQNCLFPRQ